MDEHDLERILRQDLAQGTEAFRDDLLARCLAELSSQDAAELTDGELELLAAAGDPALACQDPDESPAE